MLNMECVSGYCPCGRECKNQRFQRKQYCKFEIRRAGVKGFGLFAKQAIKASSFIVEYVGEVLDEEEYVRRKEYYHSVGQRHYYFMNIGNGEVRCLSPHACACAVLLWLHARPEQGWALVWLGHPSS
jgi:hypothetical protein